MDSVLLSKNSDNWATPKSLYASFILNDFFDPCPLNSTFNGLEIDWQLKNFVNPPYSKIKDFVNKSIDEHKKGKIVILLIPSRTDTIYFRKLVDYGVNITFITGRLRFNEIGSAPFPSCLVELTAKKTKCFWEYRNKIGGNL